MKDMITVRLDPDVWMRGLGADDSRLLAFPDGTRQQCCVGVALTQLGADDELLDGRGTVAHVRDCTPWTTENPPPAAFERFLAMGGEFVPEAAVVALRKVDKLAAVDDMVIDCVYTINDDPDTDDATKVRLLNLLTEPFGLRFELEEAAQ